MEHYRNISEAVAAAGKTCTGWKDAYSNSVVTGAEILSLFGNDEDDDGFYVVSIEGAIGYTTGQEYKTIWIYIPAEPGEVQEDKTAAPYSQQTTGNEAADGELTAAEPTIVEPSVVKPAEPQSYEKPPEVKPATKFCRKCGKQIKADAAFCRFCGFRF